MQHSPVRKPAAGPSPQPNVNYWDCKKIVEDNFDLTLLKSQKINPNCLIKEALMFELLTLGFPTQTTKDVNVATLRQQYRVALAEKPDTVHRILYIESDFESTFNDIECLIEKERISLQEIRDDESKLLSDKKNEVTRATSYFLHLINKITQWYVAIKIAQNQTWLDKFQVLIENLKINFSLILENQEIVKTRPPSPSFLPDARETCVDNPFDQLFRTTLQVKEQSRPTNVRIVEPGVSNNNENNVSIATTVVPRYVPPQGTNASVVQGNIPLQSSDVGISQFVGTTSNENNLSIASNVIPQYVPTQAMNAPVVHRPLQSSNLGASPQVFNSLFNKLPNPIEHLIQNLPVTDGLDVDSLLQFLSVTLNIQERSTLNDIQLLNLIHSHALGPLADRLTFAINNNWSFDFFHAEVLNYFIPQRLLSVIEKEKFYRLQGSNEALSAFIVSIKEAARLLRLNKSESEIVGNICSGLNREERSRLVFQSRPCTFNELNLIAVQSQNLRFADVERERFETTTSSHPRIQKINTNSNRINCYHCSKPGHIAKNCFRNPESANYHTQSKNQGNRPSATFNNVRKPDNVKCYSCQKFGHYQRDCKEKKT